MATNDSISKDCSLRSLFDSSSSEWYCTSMDEKKQLINLYKEKGISIFNLLCWYKASSLEEGRSDLADTADFALAELIDSLLE